MAITLVEQLQKRYSDVEFKFAVVPFVSDYESELEWAAYYGYDVVRRPSITRIIPSIFPIYALRRMMGRGRRLEEQRTGMREYIEALRWCTHSIAMEGISYVGDGAWSWRAGLDNYTYFYLAGKYKKPYCRFIQSFGPFVDWRVATIARRELAKLPFIPARGAHSCKECKQLLKREDRIYDFPDVACLLPVAPDEWGFQLLAAIDVEEKSYVVLSPSAVIKNVVRMGEDLGGGVGSNHVQFYKLVAEKLLNQGLKVVFLPHMYSRVVPDDDRTICREIIGMLANSKNVYLLDADIDPRQAKWLIMHAHSAIVSRYHALVAALSSGTPVLALGWNDKYQDILTYYGAESYVIDARTGSVEDLYAKALVLHQKAVATHCAKTVATQQNEVTIKLEGAFDVLNKWINEYAD